VLQPPRPVDFPPPIQVQNLFGRVGLDWTVEADGRPPRTQPCPRSDAWLPARFRRSVLDLAGRLGVNEAARTTLARQVATAELSAGRATQTTAALTIAPATGTPGAAMTARTQLPRKNACDVLCAYLAPLPRGDQYVAWLREMAATQVFWRGALGGPAVPEAVARREQERDAELLDRWFGAPPATPPAQAGNSDRARRAMQRRFGAELRRYQHRRAEAEAFLRSEPTAPGLALPFEATRSEARQLDARRRAASAMVYPVVVYRGELTPANLFISEAAIPLAGYLAIMEPLLRAAAPQAHITASLLAVAYGLLALALVPLGCLYDRVHGTCVVETLLPRLADSRTAGMQFVRAELAGVLLQQLAPEERIAQQPRLTATADAFIAWADDLAAGAESAQSRLLSDVVTESGGRILAPQRFTATGEWEMTTREQRLIGSPVIRQRRTPELISFGEKDDEIYWVLRSLWAPLGTAAALINQAGMRVWFNAANNRWGGRHPPHVTHRQGNSIDFDIGFGWRPASHKVPNVRTRDSFGQFLDDSQQDRSDLVDCLQGMNRIAGWIGVQAFILAGVTSYLYGDWALIEEAGLHLASLVEIQRPGNLFGHEDARNHADHWHFDMLVGRRPAGLTAEDPNAFPYVWQATNPALLNQLSDLANARNRDSAFFRRMAGLTDRAQSIDDFNELPDAEDWKAWFRWQSTGEGPRSGPALLPVWNPRLAEQTRQARSCLIPKLAPQPLFRPDMLPG